MSQPPRRYAPPEVGDHTYFGNSQPAVDRVLRELQRSARGVAEWIDGQGTAGEPPPDQAHDHRGGIYGRPLGLGFNVSITVNNAGRWWLRGTVSVPDPSTPWAPLDPNDAAELGGYTRTQVWLYFDSPAGLYSLEIEASTYDPRARDWGEPVAHALDFGHPGGGPQWVKASGELHIPPGLVQIAASHATSAGFVQPHYLSGIIRQ